MSYQPVSFDLVAAENSDTQKQYDFYLVPENRVLISGTVRRPDGSPVQGAVVQFFFKGEEGKTGSLIGHTFTDEDGHFSFGPLAPGIEFKMKIFYWDIMEQGQQKELKYSSIFPPVLPIPPVAPFPPMASFPPISSFPPVAPFPPVKPFPPKD
ncbi:MAG: carboxypeptidase-like regulatory domain-containing protein, partial [Desulfofundulus sp.]